MLMNRARAQLVVIDVQARLVPHVAEGEGVTANCARLAAYARRLGVPITITEHYPAGLGGTREDVTTAAGDDVVLLEKISFSAWRDDAIRQRIERLADEGRDQIVIAGMESHVCVGQTVLDLLDDGLSVFLVADAVSSREARVRDLAIARQRAEGATIVTQEMVAFEWLERGDDAAFREVIRLIKQPAKAIKE